MDDAKRYIPHRPPFLFVDEIIEMTGEKIVATKKIDPSEAFFAGHYPGNPIMPGVLLCEAIFQAGAILIAKIAEGAEEAGVPVLTRITNAKFKNIVRPGDTMTIESSIGEILANAYFMKGKASVSGRTAVTVEFACCMAKV